MKLFIVDAFSECRFGGNQAGVALLGADEAFPDELFMLQLAGELKYSETVFIKQEGPGRFKLRFFTPVQEVDLCGHATIAAFHVLSSEGLLTGKTATAVTKAGSLAIAADGGTILMEMAPPQDIYQFAETEIPPLYEAFGLNIKEMPEALLPEIVSTGLKDILLPVKSKAVLNSLTPDYDKISALSQHYQVVGFHVFALSPQTGVTADCRNFAPLYGINEEAATGTSNGALTRYLLTHGLLSENELNTFLQGEVFGRPSVIQSRLTDGKIYIGGTAKILLKGLLE